ncbi:MAG: alpha/beta hydrolase [Burkholderiales bacterium]|nr:alpha/beta hydrolase [Burkholderiales bacterium]
MLTALALPLMRAPDRAVSTLVQRWAPPPSDFLDLQGQLVHYRDEGPRHDPAPIVLIHGTAASLHTWEGWARALRGQRRVISFDLPGFGLTGPYTGHYAGRPYRGPDYARFTLDLLDALKVQRFVVAGNSLGGEVAWQLAALAPQRVDKLVLVDASGYAIDPVSMPAGFLLARTPVLNRLGEHLLPRALVVASVRDVYGDPSRVNEALVDRYFELTLREGNRVAMGERFRQMQPGADATRITTLRLPTLILWGGRDRLIPPAAAQRFQADIAGSQLVMFDTLGHVPQEEDPARTVVPVKAFLGMAPG